MFYNEIKKGKEIKKGISFFGTLNPDVPEHIYIVATDPVPDDKNRDSFKVIVVNLSSVYKKDKNGDYTKDKVDEFAPAVVLTKKRSQVYKI